MNSNKVFYNSLAGLYDEMINSDALIKNRTNLMSKIILPGMQTAADIGCGTGVDSIALTKLGLKLVAFDPSPRMLKIARENAKKFKSKIVFLNYPAENMPRKYDCKFDVVVSLGNTFANIPVNKLLKSFCRCYDILKKNGRFVFQILNYSKLLREKKRIVKISSNKGKYFIRFYDFVDDKINFNVLSFSENNPGDFKLITTRIYPHTYFDLKDKLIRAGFRKVNRYSGFKQEKYHPNRSGDIIIDCFA